MKVDSNIPFDEINLNLFNEEYEKLKEFLSSDKLKE